MISKKNILLSTILSTSLLCSLNANAVVNIAYTAAGKYAAGGKII